VVGNLEKRLALTVDGHLTYCTASEERIGKGRCNHVTHQRDNESQQQFVERISILEADDVKRVKQEQKAVAKSNQGILSWIKNLGSPRVPASLEADKSLSEQERRLAADRLLAAKFERLDLEGEGEPEPLLDHESVVIDIESRFVNFFYDETHYVHLTHMRSCDTPEENMEAIKQAVQEITLWNEWGFDKIAVQLQLLHGFILDPEVHAEIKGIGVGLEFEYYDFRNPELNKIAAKFEEIRDQLPIMVDHVTPAAIDQLHGALLAAGLLEQLAGL
jgi:hypothetical protein